MKHGRSDYDARIQDAAKIIPDDEPVFLLRAQDKLACRAVSFYADMLQQFGGDPEHVKRIKEQATRMFDWPKKDMPTPDGKDKDPFGLLGPH